MVGDGLSRGGEEEAVDLCNSGPRKVGIGASEKTRFRSNLGSSDSVIVKSSLCASDTARVAGSARCRPGVSMAGGFLPPRPVEGGASVVGLVGSAGLGVVAKIGYGSSSSVPDRFLFFPDASNGGG